MTKFITISKNISTELCDKFNFSLIYNKDLDSESDELILYNTNGNDYLLHKMNKYTNIKNININNKEDILEISKIYPNCNYYFIGGNKEDEFIVRSLLNDRMYNLNSNISTINVYDFPDYNSIKYDDNWSSTGKLANVFSTLNLKEAFRCQSYKKNIENNSYGVYSFYYSC